MMLLCVSALLRVSIPVRDTHTQHNFVSCCDLPLGLYGCVCLLLLCVIKTTGGNCLKEPSRRSPQKQESPTACFVFFLLLVG